jgi:hypothetical protein
MTQESITHNEAILATPIEFKIGDKTLTIKPLMLGAYKRAIIELQAAVDLLAKTNPAALNASTSEEQMATLLPFALTIAPGFIEKFWGIEASYLEDNCDLATLTEIIKAAVQVNRLPLAAQNIGDLLQEINRAKAGMTTGSPSPSIS